MPDSVALQIPFTSLMDAITSLGLEEKLKLLEAQIAEAEDDLLEQDPTVLADVAEARRAYRAGEYQTLQDYIADRSAQAS
ncbi:hypothetical protein [Stenomitos frigidus]|uniref:Addiction module protein n=1 Tax=Stenomitos frigidus ULC18 TaxID=2107698 RepID=A0A2T1EDH6_9CYAN|nr:hypothetical protein [Stenomitos frigidus]PSB30799.1 hypothetical protein C7B82_08050 [Stenomitos frigidus ULC18]